MWEIFEIELIKKKSTSMMAIFVFQATEGHFDLHVHWQNYHF